MKNIMFPTILLGLCLCFLGCGKEKEPQSLEEYVLERAQKECGIKSDYTLKEVKKAWKFDNEEFTLLPWVSFWDVPPEELLFTIKKDSIFNEFAGMVQSTCGLNISEYDFKRNDKYKISGYGLATGDLPGGGISEPMGGILIIDRIEKVE